MTILDKIFITVFFIGIIGIMINAITARDPEDWRVHTYSTIPAGASVLYIIGKLLEMVWSQ